MAHEEIKEKLRVLEAKGWTFERYSKTKGRWVRHKSHGMRQLRRAIEHAWKQQQVEEMTL
jgi:hypothetical protein